VVIDNLNRIGVAITPHETDTPLIIDPDTMLSLSRTLQCLKSIGWWHSEVFKEPRIVQLIRSFLRATAWISLGSLREMLPSQIFWASLSLKCRIMGKL
jgi:hypothetical protein